jgi:hypothetical protein
MSNTETPKVTIPFARGLIYNSHRVHNPDCDIIEGHIDVDTTLTYGVYIKGPRKGQEFCEYYTGRNYCLQSQKRSYSRMWAVDKVPVKYAKLWKLLRSVYESIETK